MRTFPRSRIDALTDGIFAFAMTLLVLELRLPDLPVRDGAALIADLAALWPKYLAYVISFFVLAAHWRSSVELRRVEEISSEAMGLSMVYLFFITSIPFSTSVVGLHGDLPPAVWLYAANLIVVSGLSLRLRVLEILPEHRPHARAGHARIVVVMATAALSVLVSFIVPQHAMYTYLLNLLAGPLTARWQGHAAPSGET
jgi:TMEM175 potassium channel family protein